jgi:hypothetical protein
MTQDEIIEMARQAGLTSVDKKSQYLRDCLERFAKLVAQHEREACLEIIDNFVDFPYLEPTMKAIKARGQE